MYVLCEWTCVLVLISSLWYKSEICAFVHGLCSCTRICMLCTGDVKMRAPGFIYERKLGSDDMILE